MPDLIRSVRGKLNLNDTTDNESEVSAQILEEAKREYQEQMRISRPANLRDSQQRNIAASASGRQSEASTRPQSSRIERNISGETANSQNNNLIDSPGQWQQQRQQWTQTPYAEPYREPYPQHQPGFVMNLPTRPAHTDTHQLIPGNIPNNGSGEFVMQSPQSFPPNLGQTPQFPYSYPSEEDFHTAPFLGIGNEFQQALESSDMYGPSDLPLNYGLNELQNSNHPSNLGRQS